MSLGRGTLVVLASTTNAANGTTVGSWIDLGEIGYEMTLLGMITNGATGPSSPCAMTIDLSPNNGGTVYPGVISGFSALSVANKPYAAAIRLSADIRYIRVSFGGNQGQAVTVQADLLRVTSL